MVSVHRRKGWEIPARDITPESAFLNRRAFLKGAAAIGAGALLASCGRTNGEEPKTPTGPAGERYPAKRNDAYAIDRPLTDEKAAGKYNNFYEFTTDKEGVWRLAEKLTTDPWTLECGGRVNKAKTWDVGDLVRKFDLEERAYRHRCVEAWSMAIPWTGIPLRKLIESLDPQGSAKYVKFISFLKPDEAPGQADRDYPFPYYEALTIGEATNELALLVTGSYGHPLAKAHGAPVRIAIPWKYGYKSPKSIVKIELVEERPKTFWNDLAPGEYGFESNVDPGVPHPRWSQATERFIPSDGKVEKRETLKYNGYGEMVAALYK